MGEKLNIITMTDQNKLEELIAEEYKAIEKIEGDKKHLEELTRFHQTQVDYYRARLNQLTEPSIEINMVDHLSEPLGRAKDSYLDHLSEPLKAIIGTSPSLDKIKESLTTLGTQDMPPKQANNPKKDNIREYIEETKHVIFYYGSLASHLIATFPSLPVTKDHNNQPVAHLFTSVAERNNNTNKAVRKEVAKWMSQKGLD
jgi:hypothetical protein